MSDVTKSRNQLAAMRKQLKDMTAAEFFEAFGDFWPMSPGPANEAEFKRWVKVRAGVAFDFMAAKATTLHYSKIYFIDRTNGADGATGDTWEDAKATINDCISAIKVEYASDQGGRHYLIIFRGKTTTGQAHTTQQSIDIPGVHVLGAGSLYGAAGGNESCFVMGNVSAYAKACGIYVSQSGCKFEGMKFYTPSELSWATEHPYILFDNRISEAVENCIFIGGNADGDVTSKATDAIKFTGIEGGLVKNCEIQYCYRGVYFKSGATRYAHKVVVQDNFLQGCKYGFYLQGSAGEITEECLFRRNNILDKRAYGNTMTSGIYIENAAVGNIFDGNRVAVNAAGDQSTVAYTKGSGTNHWLLNYWASTDTFNQLYAGT